MTNKIKRNIASTIISISILLFFFLIKIPSNKVCIILSCLLIILAIISIIDIIYKHYLTHKKITPIEIFMIVKNVIVSLICLIASLIDNSIFTYIVIGILALFLIIDFILDI